MADISPTLLIIILNVNEFSTQNERQILPE